MYLEMDDLNHPKVKPFTREIGLQLKLDPAFLDFVFAKERPECFRYECENAEEAWTCYIPDDVTVAYPLWSTNGDQTLLLLSASTIAYGKGWHDNPDMEMISKSSQGLLATLLHRIWESELSDEVMREASEFCGFRYLSELMEFVNSPMDEGMGRDQRWEQFLSAIDAKG